MITYSEFQPTQFDPKGLALHDQQRWLVAPVMQTRDSSCLDRSNFRVMLQEMGGESETVQVHRFNHWGPGWFEIIIINPSDEKAVKIAEDSERALADYPVLSDEDYSQLEWETAAEYWKYASLRERYDIVKSCYGRGASVFAIRRDVIPETDTGELASYLAGKI